MELKFRKLRADEVDARVGQVKDGSGYSLLLYKDARCDMNVLDETVGAMNWMRSHSRENANCTVSIWDNEKQQWISKEDTGTESRTEAEKGLASDSFKRACTNWGIGRELYTAPFIWIKGECDRYARYEVRTMEYDENGNISALTIYSKGKEIFKFGAAQNPAQAKMEEAKEHVAICEDCCKAILAYKMSNGTVVTAKEMAERSKAKYGRVLCTDCAKRVNNQNALDALTEDTKQ